MVAQEAVETVAAQRAVRRGMQPLRARSVENADRTLDGGEGVMLDLLATRCLGRI